MITTPAPAAAALLPILVPVALLPILVLARKDKALALSGAPTAPSHAVPADISSITPSSTAAAPRHRTKKALVYLRMLLVVCETRGNANTNTTNKAKNGQNE